MLAVIVLVFGLPCVCLSAAVSHEADQCPGIKEGQICCGGKIYDLQQKRTCCSLKNEKGAKVYLPTHLCHGGEADEPWEPCGNSRLDYRYSDCCEGKRFERGASQCCLATGRPRGTTSLINPNDVCCNGQALQDGQVCCNTDTYHGPIVKGNSSHDRCCERHDGQVPRTFSSSTHYCDLDNGQVKEIPQIPQLQHNDQAEEIPQLWPIRPPICLRGRKEEQGEKLHCCGDQPYRQSLQTCCQGFLHNISTHQAVCCFDRAYAVGDTNNTCLRRCGNRNFNTELQACCGGKVRTVKDHDKEECCGDNLINTDTHSCCADMVIDRSKVTCCNKRVPIYPKLMRCQQSGWVKLRTMAARAQDLGQQLCTNTLPTWGESWRALSVSDMLQLQGRVERCGIRQTTTSITIPLSPAIVRVGGDRYSRCLKKNRLKLVVKLEAGRLCHSSKSRLKRQLRDKTLDIFVPDGKVKCGRRGARVTLEAGDLALVLQSHRMDSAMVQSSLP